MTEQRVDLLALADACERHMPSGRYDFNREWARDTNERIAAAIGLPLAQWLGDEALGNRRQVSTRISDYVGSLDAAISMVPEGLGISMAQHGRRGDDCSAYVGKSDSDARGNFMTDTFHGEAKTMALALCSAALKARAGRELPKQRKRARHAQGEPA